MDSGEAVRGRGSRNADYLEATVGDGVDKVSTLDLDVLNSRGNRSV